jgi:hypothetical protein
VDRACDFSNHNTRMSWLQLMVPHSPCHLSTTVRLRPGLWMWGMNLRPSLMGAACVSTGASTLRKAGQCPMKTYAGPTPGKGRPQ